MIPGGIILTLGFFLASFSTKLWHLYLTQGVMVGIGYSFVYSSGISLVGQYFTTKRGTALGIATSGSGFGQLIMVSVIGTMLNTVGWRATLRYLALIELIGVSLCCFLVKRLTPLDSNPKTSILSSAHIYFADHQFVLLYFGYAFVSFVLITE